jgi:hypothetical protein
VAPGSFADATANLMGVSAGFGYEVEVEILRPRYVNRQGPLTVYVRMSMSQNPVSGGPASFFGWFSFDSGPVDLATVGLRSSVVNGIAAGTTWESRSL